LKPARFNQRKQVPAARRDRRVSAGMPPARKFGEMVLTNETFNGNLIGKQQKKLETPKITKETKTCRHINRESFAGTN
jgi:hypothetical protein